MPKTQNFCRNAMLGMLLVACGPNGHAPTETPEPAPVLEEDDSSLNLTGISSFITEPGLCDAFHSKSYYCDGYTQKNIPLLPNGANETAENSSSTAPASGYVGLQVIGTFDPARPSVIYMHGWNVEGASKVYGFPDQWAQQANLAGYNVLHFHWSSIAYDNGAGCPGAGWFGFGNIPCNAAHALYKSGGGADAFLSAYKARFTGYTRTVRLVSQSLSVPLAILTTYRMYKRSDFAGVTKPSRLDFIDPFVQPGMGGNRDKPYDGQIPSDAQLAPDYKNNIVTSFVSGSSCHSNWNPLPPNHLSQYCQTEGMAWNLLKTYNVGMIDFSSVVGGATASDFKRIMLFQAFSGSAFKSDLLTRHVAPNASYFYSFAPGTPANGYDASTSDAVILTDSKKQGVSNINMRKIQTAGFDTITLQDDAFAPN